MFLRHVGNHVTEYIITSKTTLCMQYRRIYLSINIHVTDLNAFTNITSLLIVFTEILEDSKVL
jgi:hypothetical protein